MTCTLKEWRKKKGVKVNAVANYLGVSRQTYCKYENAQEKMSVSQAKAVCDFLDVPVDEIFFVNKGKFN
jgi:putative transcriptional regulator